MPWPVGVNPAPCWKDWQPKEFKPTHCTQIIDMMSRGRGPQSFSSANNIGKTTFYQWVKDYPEFKLAYNIGKQKCDAYMLELLHENKVEVKIDGTSVLNMQVFKEIKKSTRCDYDKGESALHLLTTPDASPKTMMHVILCGVAQGLVGLEEADQMARLIETSQKIGDAADLIARVDQLEKMLEAGVKTDEFKEE